MHDLNYDNCLPRKAVIYHFFQLSMCWALELIPNAASKVLCSEHLQSEVLQGDSKDYEAKQTLAYNDSTHLYTWSECFWSKLSPFLMLYNTAARQSGKVSLSQPNGLWMHRIRWSRK